MGRIFKKLWIKKFCILLKTNWNILDVLLFNSNNLGQWKCQLVWRNVERVITWKKQIDEKITMNKSRVQRKHSNLLSKIVLQLIEIFVTELVKNFLGLIWKKYIIHDFFNKIFILLIYFFLEYFYNILGKPCIFWEYQK